MSEDVNQPEGQSLPPATSFSKEESGAPAQSASVSQQHPAGRRRRRRRKNAGKGPQQTQPQNPATEQGASESQPRPQQPPQGQRRNGRRRKHPRQFGSNQPNSNGKLNQGGSTQGLRQGGGNNNNGRRRRGRRQVIFVGPMDHSYRAQQGNVADDITPNQNGRFRPDVNGSGPSSQYAAPIPPESIRDDAPTRIFCFVEDLFFLAKIQETARKVGVKVGFLKNEKESLAALYKQEEKPALIVVDLNNLNAKPLQLIPKLRTKFKKGTSILGFVSHIQGDLKMKAQEVGCDVVMPRSAFSQNLPNIFRRHVQDEAENEPQPAGI